MIQLYKGKGDKSDFGNQRFIHIKEEIPKSFEHIVVTKMKPIIIKYVSKYQIGAIPGHQASEHLFTLKSVISLYISLGIPSILFCYDIAKYFDSESLRDAMNALYEYGIKGKLYRLIFELNKNNTIKIQTSVGLTEIIECGENVSQVDPREHSRGTDKFSES